MRSPHTLSTLPLSILALFLHTASAEPDLPTAIRRQAPDAGAKILPEHLAFAAINLPLIPHDLHSLDQAHESSDPTRRWYQPAFRPVHDTSGGDGVLRRAGEALAILEKRQACFAGMNSCANIGKPQKCCQEGTYCQNVDDQSLGEVACCPLGSTCAGSAKCPADAVTCPASLGGGCCLSGYECEGSICVPISKTKTSTTRTRVETQTKEESAATVTTTRTTMIEGNPSTVVVTMTVTRTAEPDPETRTVTEEVTESLGAPYRPTQTSTSDDNDEETSTEAEEPTSSDETITSAPESTQTGCPTGFYGCLATHGGGCCRTDRNCEVHDCPAGSSTTVVSDGQTIVVPVSGAPSEDATATCADGWFMCGKNAGPRPGCCPSGYDCGTASCYTVQESQTGAVQKEQPETDGAGNLRVGARLLRIAVAVGGLLLWI